MVARGSETGSKNVMTMERTSDRELTYTRMFNAPPDIVFDAWTKADLVKQWWAPASMGVSMVSCEADVRVGGTYRYVLRHRNDNAFAFFGKYTEITPPSRLVYTSFFEPIAGEGAFGGDEGAVIVTVTFEEQNGKTHFVSRELYPSKDVLDAAIASGMEKGAHVTMDQLDELVSSLR